MNAADITALITAATALIGTVSGLIVLVVHIIQHQPIGQGGQPVPPGPSGPVVPTKPGSST